MSPQHKNERSGDEDRVYGEPTTGIIARIVTDRGFAFVRSGDKDYFLHHTDYNGEFLGLREKMSIDFTPAETSKGPRACFAEKSR